MSLDPRGMSLGRAGEANWAALSSSLKLAPESMRALVVADASDVRNEIRRRLEALGGNVQRLEPKLEILDELHGLARAGGAPVVWIEAREVDDPRRAWNEALRALNRGRDLIADAGEVSVVLAGPRWLLELAQRTAPDLSSVLDPVAMFDDTLDPLPKAGGPLCWMHLSDPHVLGQSWEQDMVLRGLVEGLPALLEEIGRRPQLLFVTGDIAARGSKIEYEGAQRTLTRICEQIGLSPRELFLVPGNHDVERSRISKAAARQHSALLELAPDALRTEVGELIGDGDLFAKLFGGRLREYCEFTRRVLGIGRSVEITQPWRSDVIMVSGVPVGVASICTSWSSGTSDDKGKLIVGRRQLETLANELEQAGAALRIALLHHPLSWLCDAEERELRAVLRERFDVVLHGHAHDTAADLVHRRGRDHVEIGCGAAYAGLGQDRQHGFWVGQIEPDGGTLELDAFVWDGRGVGRWRRDAGFVREAPEGRLSWSLALARLGGGGAVAGARPERIPELIMGALRRATARVYAAQSFIGFPDSAPKPRATLDSMFVPLNFRHEETGETFSLAEIDWLHCTETAASRTVVLGKPGSGKSTLCRYLAVEAARVDGGPVPLLVTVRDWAGDTQLGLLDLAARTATNTLAVTVDAKALAQLCENGRAALLIDGVDEASAAAREALRDRVHAFVERYPKVPVLVTSRIVGYDQAPIDHGFMHWRVEDFDDEQLDAFIERWYEIAEPDDPTERMRRRDGLRAALEAEPRAKELARTPLLATLIALVHRHQAHLPAERARLYQLCIDLLVVTWPAENRRALPDLDGYWQIARLEELALWMQRRREGSEGEEEIRGAELERQLLHLLCVHQEGLDDGLRRSLAVKWRRWLVSNSVLQEQQHDHYAFIHLSLMEYLAGRGVLRELAGKGHQAIAAFVQTHCVMPLWHESLLLMLGSEGHDRGLIETVAEALLDEPSWDACVFLVSMLREEVEIGPALRDRILDSVSSLAPTEGWDEIRSLLHVITQFGRTHGEPVRAWFQRQFARRSGQALLGVLAIAPDGINATPALQRRSDTDLGLAALLDLTPAHAWGQWAHRRANPATLLEWCIGTPLLDVAGRAVSWGLASTAPLVWVVGLLRRAAWIFDVSADAAGKLRPCLRGGGEGVPAGVRWTSGGVVFDVCLRPGFECKGCIPQDHQILGFYRGRLDVAERYSGNLARYFGGYFPAYLSVIARELARDFMGYFAQNLAQDFGPHLPHPRPTEGSISVSPVAIAKILAPTSQLSAKPKSTQWPLRMLAEAHAGFALSSAFPSVAVPRAFVEVRIQNRWIHTFFDKQVALATRHAPLTPQQHALLLALGLAQAQTTNAWPDSEHWRSWFSGDPPSDWLCAYLWHLCFAISDPDNRDHITRAEACLDRGDWPELVAELRKYPVRPLAPEIAALFT